MEILPMPLLPMTSERTVKLCRQLPDFYNGQRTIFIASYPKSGTTWMQAIVFYLTTNGSNQDFSHISSFTPFYEIDKHWEESNFLSKYRENHAKLGVNIFNTHLRCDMLPHGNSFKYIYIIRDPKDVVVSFFHHLSNQDGGFDGTFKEFLVQWCCGDIAYGRWTDHLRSWFEVVNKEKILILRYEDLHKNIKQNLMKISNFLDLKTSDEVINSIAHLVQFETMKSNQSQFQPISVIWKNDFNFFRKGSIGDSATFINEEENSMIESMLLSSFPNGFPDCF
jgi:hypothetical protein